jgi:hypothetical protein
MDKFDTLDETALAALRTEKHTALQTLLASETPSVDDVATATALAAEVKEIDAEIAARTTAATEAGEQFAALKAEFSGETETETEDEVTEPEGETEEPEEVETEVEAPEAEVAASAKGKQVARLAAKTARPPAPAVEETGRVSITAAADVPGFALGADLSDMRRVGEAVVSKMRGFQPPNGDGETEDIRKFPVASFRLDFPEDLQINRGTDEMEVLSHAANETRLEGESLVASAGWCAPSETLYDLCAGETLDGILSVPEVQVNRGGIKYTSGPDFSTLYTNTGFVQTEAQAIAGTAKTCYEVACPTFTEARLDAVGLCIKVPILLNSAYPEVTERTTSGAMIAHQHRINARVIAAMATASGAARVITGLGATMADTLEGLELLADQKRQQYRLGLNETLEVVVPFWVKGAYRNDLGRRVGVGADAVTDQMIGAHFAARNLKVSFVYDWQDLVITDEAYPATYNALMYPAGTFVKGVSDVINLNAVYDAASLAVNTYTGLFMEQGLLVARMCFTSDLITLPICNAGRTGASNLTCA